MRRFLPYYNYLKDGEYSKYTLDDFTGDVKRFGVYFKVKTIKQIIQKDIQGWILFFKAPVPKGKGLRAKTLSRKLTALGYYFNWLTVSEVVTEKGNPMRDIANSRITSPLPEVLFEEECSRLLTVASVGFPDVSVIWSQNIVVILPNRYKQPFSAIVTVGQGVASDVIVRVCPQTTIRV